MPGGTQLTEGRATRKLPTAAPQRGAYPPPPPYPGQQPPGYPTHFAQTKAKGGGCLKVGLISVAVLVLAGILVGLIASLGSNDDDGDIPADQSGGQDVYAVGQTAHTGDFDVTVHTVTDPYVDPSGIIQPTPGNRYITVEATITNPTDQLVPWSSLLQSEVMDSQGRPGTIAIAGAELPRLDGDLPIQGERRGWLVFEVPADATGLTLRIKGNVTATGSLFQLTP